MSLPPSYVCVKGVNRQYTVQFSIQTTDEVSTSDYLVEAHTKIIHIAECNVLLRLSVMN